MDVRNEQIAANWSYYYNLKAKGEIKHGYWVAVTAGHVYIHEESEYIARSLSTSIPNRNFIFVKVGEE